MNECRGGASSVVYQGHMIVTGGSSQHRKTLASVEELNLAQQDGHWVESQFKLAAPSWFTHVWYIRINFFFLEGVLAATGSMIQYMKFN